MWTKNAYCESKIPLNGEANMSWLFLTELPAPEWSRSQPCGAASMLLPNVRLHHRRRWPLYNFEHLAANQSFASSQQHGNQTRKHHWHTTTASTLVWSMVKPWANQFLNSWHHELLLGIVKQNGTWNHTQLLLNTKNWRQCVGNGSATKLLLQQFLCFLPAACYFGST